MRTAILGAGFTGLTSAYRLLQKGHQVTIFEKEKDIGGLAIGFSNPDWNWTLERSYHHWFTNDSSIFKLAGEINHEVIIKRPATDIFVKGKALPFDNALSLLSFSHLPILDRIRMGMVIFYLKQINNYKKLEGKKASNWIRRWMGEKAFSLIWDPLLGGKFGEYKDQIALTWFWARIKKRTPKLAYPEGGFKAFADKLGEKIKKMGGQIDLNSTVFKISNVKNKCIIQTEGDQEEFDKVIVTLPSPVFAKIANLPASYKKRITSIPHLHAQVLILILKKPFMDKTYWLNITDKNFPFLVLAEHTNFMDPKHYGNQHILYIGNYLPSDHPFLKMTDAELLKKFIPYLEKISPNLKSKIINHKSFIGFFAQPIVTPEYPNLIPEFQTPLKNIFLANIDMVYPWDRGTNYAVELGEQVANLILKNEP